MPRRPVTRAKVPQKEVSLHMSVAAYLRRACPDAVLWFHVPNGEKRDARTAGKLKAMGVLAGVPDFVFVMPNAQAAFIELKVGDNGLSSAQIEFRAQALSSGCAYATARSMEEVEAILTRWLAAYDLKPRASVIQGGVG